MSFKKIRLLISFILKYWNSSEFQYFAWGFGGICKFPQGVTALRIPSLSRGFKQASGLFKCARGVKPLWKIATKWLILISIILSPGILLFSASEELYIRPHVNNVTTTSAKILWVTETKAPPGKVTLKSKQNSQKGESIVSAIEGREELLHTAAFKDLKPFTEYEYTVICNNKRAKGKFITAPEKGRAIQFVVYGDTRSNPEDHLKVSKAIAIDDPMFVACSGDLVSKGTKWKEWKEQFFDPAEAYLCKSAIWPMRGNHEKDGKFLYKLFDMPGNEHYFSFDFGDLHFVILDQYIKDKLPEMLEWFENDLKNNNSKWTFVGYHQPTFNTGGHASTWGRKDFLPIMEKYGVDIVLTGHSHLYERFLPIGPEGKKPIIHIVTGGGGAPLKKAEKNPALVGGTGISELHYCFFKINGDTLEMKVKKPDHTIIDQMTLIKKKGVYQDEVMKKAITTQKAEELLPDKKKKKK